MNINEYIQSGVIETVIMGLADPREVAELEQLRRQHPEVEAYAAECEQWLLDTAMQQAKPVPGEVKEKLLAAIPFAGEPAADTVSTPTSTAVVKSMRTFKYVAAAAVLLLVGSAVLNLYLYKQYDKVKQAYSDLNSINVALATQNKTQEAKLAAMDKAAAIFSSPAYVKVTMAGKENYSATVFWNKGTTEVYLVANNLPKAPAGKQYQLWALVDGKPVDAGVLQDCSDLCALKAITQAQAFAITLEKEGGSPTPDLSQLYVMGKLTV